MAAGRASTPSGPTANPRSAFAGRSRCSSRGCCAGVRLYGAQHPAIWAELLPAADRQGVRRGERRRPGSSPPCPMWSARIGMVLWGRHSDKTGERKWHGDHPLRCHGGRGWRWRPLTPIRSRKIAVLCIAGWGFFSILPVFWTLPTAFLSGDGAAAGIAADQFDRQSRRLFRPAGFRLPEGHDPYGFLRHGVLRRFRHLWRGAGVAHGP